MSFDKELKYVRNFALGLLAYMVAASAAMIYVRHLWGDVHFTVAWIIALIIPFNFALCSILCIIFYRKKENKMKEIQEHLTELSDMAVFEDDDDKNFDFDKLREERRGFKAQAVPE